MRRGKRGRRRRSKAEVEGAIAREREEGKAERMVGDMVGHIITIRYPTSPTPACQFAQSKEKLLYVFACRSF